MQGSANAALYTTSYSIFSSHYDAGEFMKVNSIFKGTIGVGLLLGLLFGTLLYVMGGYFLPFLVYSTIMLLAVPFTAQLIPSKPLKNKEETGLSDKHSDDEVEFDQEDDENPDNTTATVKRNSAAPQVPRRKRVIPLLLVWKLLVNPIILK